MNPSPAITGLGDGGAAEANVIPEDSHAGFQLACGQLERVFPEVDSVPKALHFWLQRKTTESDEWTFFTNTATSDNNWRTISDACITFISVYESVPHNTNERVHWKLSFKRHLFVTNVTDDTYRLDLIVSWLNYPL